MNNYLHVAIVLPEFVEWIVAKYGPLPEGEINQDLYARLSMEYEGVGDE